MPPAPPFPHLFNPIRVGSKTLKHRLNFGAHTANMSAEGLPAERHLGYYLERAIGGAAMIVVEPVPVHRTAVLTRGNFRHGDDGVIPHFRRITDACHEHGAVMIQQLYHVGALGAHGDFDLSYQPNWSPSGLPSMHDQDGSHAMTRPEIEELVEGFRAGRAPGEGGGLRRLRDHGRVQRAVRAVLVAVQQPPGRRLRRLVREPHALLVTDACEDPRAVRRGLRDRGVRERRPDPARRALGRGPARGRDVARRARPLRLRDGGHRQLLRVHPPDAHLRLRGQARSALCRADQASHPSREGAVGEPHPHPGERGRRHRRRAGGHGEHRAWPDRGPAHGEQGTRGAGRGRAPLPLVQPDVLGTALARLLDQLPGQPFGGREFEWGGDRFTRTDAPRKVLVVGGGPAGLEAARVAAERGHRVTLAEASDKLGGQFRLAGMQPRRAQILDLIDWYERQLTKLQVVVRLNTPMEDGRGRGLRRGGGGARHRARSPPATAGSAGCPPSIGSPA